MEMGVEWINIDGEIEWVQEFKFSDYFGLVEFLLYKTKGLLWRLAVY